MTGYSCIAEIRIIEGPPGFRYEISDLFSLVLPFLLQYTTLGLQLHCRHVRGSLVLRHGNKGMSGAVRGCYGNTHWSPTHRECDISIQAAGTTDNTLVQLTARKQQHEFRHTTMPPFPSRHSIATSLTSCSPEQWASHHPSGSGQSPQTTPEPSLPPAPEPPSGAAGTLAKQIDTTWSHDSKVFT